MNIKNKNITHYVRKSRVTIFLYTLLINFSLFYGYNNLRNEQTFCFIVGTAISSVILYINIYIIIMLSYKLLMKKFGIIKFLACTFLSFLLSTLLIMLVAFSYKKLLLGLIIGIFIPITINFLEFLYNHYI